MTTSRVRNERIGTVKDFAKISLEISPKRYLKQTDSKMDRINAQIRKNSFLEVEPSGNHSVVFQKIIRESFRQNDKDVGPGVIRIADTTADRLYKSELSPFNQQIVKGHNRYEKIKKNLFTEEAVTWVMPEAGADQTHVQIHPRSKWGRFLPKVTEPKKLHCHLHQKTHFKGS